MKAGELHSSADCDELAQFLYASLQGAILQSKVEHMPCRSNASRRPFSLWSFGRTPRLITGKRAVVPTWKELTAPLPAVQNSIRRRLWALPCIRPAFAAVNRRFSGSPDNIRNGYRKNERDRIDT